MSENAVIEWDRDRVWQAVREGRARLAADLEHLTQEQWHCRSHSAAWTVEQTLAHLTAGASLGRLAWLRSMIGARFNADVHNQRRLEEHLGRTPHETWQRFAAVVDSRVEPARTTWAWLGEVIVHGTDIRSPLGIDSAPDAEAVTYVAQHFAERDFAVHSSTMVEELELAATDAPFHHGQGPRVEGPVLDLLMVMSGRSAFLPNLTGPGVPTLRQRLAL
ncbi:maleylpyruvate isomerase family mycothiol-dependent enzyme [Micrococcus terreus]|uniref:maleylpyruvate isomerase family mycothiol-dependent enzyme n=1 Tax=Micrococcus terreus TaxID=574650 RepID=UPI003016BC07